MNRCRPLGFTITTPINAARLRAKLVGMFIGASALLVGLLPGCGEGDSGRCGKVQPCGGNIAGTWKVTDSCVNSTTQSVESGWCDEGLVADLTAVKLSGSFSFRADLTYTITTATSGSEKLTCPSSSLNWDGTKVTCAEFDTRARQKLAHEPDSGVQSVSCMETLGSCECIFVHAPNNDTQSGTYKASGARLTLVPTAPDTEAQEQDYCVLGGTLHFVTFDRARVPGQERVIAEDIVASKQ